MHELTLRSIAPFDLDMAEFASPPACFHPVYAWVWNGKITYEGAKRQLDDMARVGIRGVYILPESKSFRPNTMRTYLEPDYLTDEYMLLSRRACEYALSLGMCVWLYDEDGWPSGCAGGRVKAQYPRLERHEIARRADGSCERKPSGGVDILNDGHGRAFIETTHAKYAASYGNLLGEGIPLIFTDEPSAGKAAWPSGLEAKFKAKYGYDMNKFLPALMDEANAQTEEDRKARADYGILLGELFASNYFRPIRAWCAQRGMLSAGHLNHDDITDGCELNGYGSVLPLLRELDLPGVDVIWRQLNPPRANGESPCPDGNRFFPRFAASAAAQSGRRLALSESFAIYGAGLTADDMRYVVNYQLARGINIFNFMSASYSKDGALPIVARPGFVSEMPGYSHLRDINAYTARASLLMSLGSPATDTALYFPARDIWAGGEDKRRAIAAFEREGERLERARVDFDIIDDEGIRMAREEGGQLRLGIAAYAHIVIPGTPVYMPEDVKSRVSEYRGDGAPEIDVEGENIRARYRMLENGDKIAFLFNESAGESALRVRLPAGARARALDPRSGMARDFSDGEEVRLPGGDALVLYLSQGEKVAFTPRKEREICAVSDFTLTKISETRVEREGLRKYASTPEAFGARLGDWSVYFGEAFSGEAAYTARVELGVTDKNTEYLIDLGRVENSARVLIDGWEAGIAGMTPMRVRAPGERIIKSGGFELRIEVANTLANQLAFNAPLGDYPAYEIGPYNQRTLLFEQKSVSGGLYGPVRILAIE